MMRRMQPNTEKNADEYISQLNALHQWVQTEIDKIPPEQRVLITSHDAFSYFGNRYGMEIRGLQGISTQADFGLKDVTSLVDLIVARGIRAIFLETSMSERSISCGSGGRACQRQTSGHRRQAILRCYGGSRHTRGQLHRHGACQREHDDSCPTLIFEPCHDIARRHSRQ